MPEMKVPSALVEMMMPKMPTKIKQVLDPSSWEEQVRKHVPNMGSGGTPCAEYKVSSCDMCHAQCNKCYYIAKPEKPTDGVKCTASYKNKGKCVSSSKLLHMKKTCVAQLAPKGSDRRDNDGFGSFSNGARGYGSAGRTSSHRDHGFSSYAGFSRASTQNFPPPTHVDEVDPYVGRTFGAGSSRGSKTLGDEADDYGAPSALSRQGGYGKPPQDNLLRPPRVEDVASTRRQKSSGYAYGDSPGPRDRGHISRLPAPVAGGADREFKGLGGMTASVRASGGGGGIGGGGDGGGGEGGRRRSMLAEQAAPAPVKPGMTQSESSGRRPSSSRHRSGSVKMKASSKTPAGEAEEDVSDGDEGADNFDEVDESDTADDSERQPLHLDPEMLDKAFDYDEPPGNIPDEGGHDKKLWKWAMVLLALAGMMVLLIGLMFCFCPKRGPKRPSPYEGPFVESHQEKMPEEHDDPYDGHYDAGHGQHGFEGPEPADGGRGASLDPQEVFEAGRLPGEAYNRFAPGFTKGKGKGVPPAADFGLPTRGVGY